MSTQAASSILFTHTSPQQGFKLLELPPELADLLTSKEAPTLELKSPTPQEPTTTTTDPENREYVNLCTPTKTYLVRQVQSSNSIHIIRPSDSGVQRGDINIVGGGDDDELNLVETMTAIAKCGSTLELHTPPDGFSAVPVLERILPVYDEVEGAEQEVEQRGDVIRRVFDDVPVSRAQCEAGWTELCAFVLGRGDSGDDVAGWCRRPSRGPSWMQFLVQDLWRSVLDEGMEEPFPRTLFESIVRRVCEAGDGQLFEDLKWTSIDKARCTQWVGETYLEAMAPTTASGIGRSEFLNAWKDLLPESWRNDVTFSKLTENSYKHPDPTTICFVYRTDRQKIKKNVSTDASAATAAKKTRNWHELFKNQKRQKR
ncbi:sister chromatid cohesion protein Dcc1 [Aspergillus nomiae NRRL 13137]|uniref:Sister chromatid cohesion protein Dcc1 n=1 Tax=Aspergillus nomiae NRRL (strain ATCC 15546 / NRRL 13137 / CBS 260.88 / M93) TaxID=1509407 RepID=A0A0L1JB18_ASPN3|nr:sister chromatid cohesion protein Dcc1 [Aspergillus nomiae NRRL 13137]KNG88628.1 sister chromatid cohesion protein Dcc1 [Aspergillus nomiae NRRL 13137]